MANGMLSLNEVMEYLDLDKTGVEEFVRKDKLDAYKVGGVYLRFPKEQVCDLKQEITKKEKWKKGALDSIRNFWEFYVRTN